MINRRIISELRKKKPHSSIYWLIEKIRRKSGYRITLEDAACLLAGDLGIDVAKYLAKEDLDRLRTLNSQTKVVEVEKKRGTGPHEFKIKGIPLDIPYLQSSTASDCQKMSDTYQIFYLLENSIRSFIRSRLDSIHHGTDWWGGKVPTDVKREVDKRIKRENRNRWHAKRGAHRIHYTDFGDLKHIMVKNWDSFKKFFPGQTWVVSRLSDLELSRNIIAHNNPLPADEVRRIKLYFGDWTKQLKGT